MDYKNGFIYYLELDGEMIYIGSSATTPPKRLCKHKSDYKCWMKGTCNKISWFDKVTEDRIKDIKIYELERYPCDSKRELEMKEGEYIRKYKDEIYNRCIPGRTKKEADREYREQNKDKIAEQNKEYYQENKDKIAEYYQANKDKIAEQKGQRLECVCGTIYTRSNYKRHIRSKYHLHYVANMSEGPSGSDESSE